MASKVTLLQELLEPAVAALGFELWGVEYLRRGKQPLLRLYIEHEKGITVDDCAKVSRQVSGVLDVEDPITGEYQLEVSSPGMDCQLFKLAHYEKFIGSKLSVRLRMPYEGQRNFTGLLSGVEGDEVVLTVDQHDYLFPLDSIEKAKVIPTF